jgi:RNA polymerase sigma factor (TIGR02999 family)
MEKSDVTQLLVRLKSGENKVYEELYPLIYGELRQIAYGQMRGQSADHTMTKTALVHEAYLKMIDQTTIDFSDKSHFLAIASKCMRQILIDHARKKHAQKRGGNQKDLTFIDDIFNNQQQKAKELIDIDAALNELEKLNERLAQVVEMRFFGEMSIDDTAQALGISQSTVKRDWLKARGWLYKELKGKFKME